MPQAAAFSIEPISGRALRSVAVLCSLVMAAMIYLLITLPAVRSIDCASGCQVAAQAAHLPRGTGDLDIVHHVLAARAAPSAVKAAPSGASGPRGPALVALVTALVAALLAFFPARGIRAFHATVEAVMGVGRWHRTVVLHL